MALDPLGSRVLCVGFCPSEISRAVMILLFGFFVFLLSLSLGSWILKKTGFFFKDHLEEASFAFALGYGLVGYVIYGLGLLGLLRLLIVGSVLLIGGLFLLREEVRWLIRGREAVRCFTHSRAEPFFYVFLTTSVFVLFVALAFCFLPPTANDALTYHLNLPKRFVQAGKIEYFPYLINSLFPFLIQMHYTLALLLAQPELAQVFHFLTGLGIFTGLVSLGRRMADTRLGLVAGLIFLATPLSFNQMSIPYNDLALAFFTFYAVFALILACETSQRPPLRLFALMGVYSGFALSVKYLALLHILLLIVLWTGEWIRAKKSGWESWLKPLMVYTLFFFLFSFIWYLRSYLIEGNPLYPYFPSIFGGSGKEYDLAKQGYGKTLVDLVLAPWRMTMDPEHFGGSWAQLGPLYLASLPCLVIYLAKNLNSIWVRLPGLFGIGFFLLWFFLVQNMRFLLPAVPFLSLVVAASALAWMGPLILVLALQIAICFYHRPADYAYLLGKLTKDDYLREVERSYPVSQWMNKEIGSQATVLNAEEVRMFYFDQQMIRESALREKSRYSERIATARELVSFLSRLGVTHLLVIETEVVGQPSVPKQGGIYEWMKRPEFKGTYTRLLYAYRRADTDTGWIHHYSVYELTPVSP